MFVSLTSNVAGQFLMYLGVILLARTFSPTEFGEFRYLFNICAVFNLVVLLGRDAFIIKTRQAKEDFDISYINEFIAGLINTLVIFFVLLFLALWFEYAFLSFQLDKYILCILMICFWSLANLLIAILKVESKILTTQVLSNFLQRSLRFLFFVAVFLFFYNEIINAYYAMVISQIFFVLILLAFLNGSSRNKLFEFNIQKVDYKFNFKESSDLFFTTIVIALSLKIDILVLGFISEWEKVAVYEIILMLSTIVLLPQIASHKVTEINYINLPHNNILRTNAVDRAIKYAIIPVSLILIFPEQILNIFGPDYTVGSRGLVFLSLGYFISIFLGSPFETLMMNGHTNIGTRILSIQLFIATLLIIIFFRLFDLYGLIFSVIVSLLMGKVIARKYCLNLGLFVNPINYKLCVITMIFLCMISIIPLLIF
tara:strand:+ start:1192 stop:2472 length:1281 start_codon:yes stop_codon:yes gene_type:complete